LHGTGDESFQGLPAKHLLQRVVKQYAASEAATSIALSSPQSWKKPE
jgi:hypothetical protein